MKKNIMFLFIILLSVNLVFADNGVWNFAEDVRPGTFGADEGNSSPYIFENPVEVKNDFTVIGNVGIGTSNPSAKLDVIGNVKMTDLDVSSTIKKSGVDVLSANEVETKINSKGYATKTYVNSKVGAVQPVYTYSRVGACYAGDTKLRERELGETCVGKSHSWTTESTNTGTVHHHTNSGTSCTTGSDSPVWGSSSVSQTCSYKSCTGRSSYYCQQLTCRSTKIVLCKANI